MKSRFAFPAPFSCHTAKNVTRDPALVAADFNARDYATLVAHPLTFWKFLEEFLCLVGLSRHYTLDEETYPRFLHMNGEGGDGSLCFHSYSGSYQFTPDRADSKLETSIDRLFVEGGSGSQAGQGGYASVGKGTKIQPVTEATGIVYDDMAPLQPRRQRKRKTIVADAGGSSHPPKKLREDHGTLSGPSVAGKSRSTVQMLLAGAVLNVEVRGESIPTLPFVTSSVSATPEREGGDHTDFVTGLNLRTISAPQRLVISSDSSYHSGANVVEAEVNPAVIVKEKTVKPSLFATDSSSAGGVDPNAGVFSDLTGSDFLVSGVRTVIDPNTDLQKFYVPRWSETNGSRFDDGHVCHEMVNEFAPLKFFASIRGIEHDQLFTEFNVGAARQMSLSAEVRMRIKYNIKEKRMLKSVVEEKDELLKVRDKEIENLKAQMALKEAKAAKAIRLCAEASNFVIVKKSLRDEVNAVNERNTILEKERDALDVKVVDLEASGVIKEREMTDLSAQLTSFKSHNDSLVHKLEFASSRLQEKLSNYENLTKRLEEFQDAQLKVVIDKFDKLYADFVEMALHLEEKFYHHLLTTIFSRRWLVTHGMKLVVTKCLHSPEYLSALRAGIGKAIEKGMQDGLSARITHGTEGMALTDVATYNPFADADYIFALQHLQSVNFSLLAELRSNKDAGVDTLMNILRLEETLAERLGLTESQPYVDQLMVAIHHSLDKVIVGATSLSFTLDVSNVGSRRLEKISQYCARHYCCYNTLSITLASASTVAPISVDDYEVAIMDDQASTDGNADPFPNFDDAELNMP
uniref:Transposase (Putative), gypsy type n=1 Tax=Tanacetum cinerariifolium TaxID=118510 RepID=A0A699H7P9_TANCI|nr:hypothetical protein [Tanacetum cinerariifolium]